MMGDVKATSVSNIKQEEGNTIKSGPRKCN